MSIKTGNSPIKNLMPEQDHGPSTVDVLIVYTPSAMNWANTNSSGIQNIINQSMATAQLAADNSNVHIEFRLVHSQLVEYEESGNSLTDLQRLTASPSFNLWGSENAGFLDEVHQIRDNHSADLVALFTNTSDVGGIAWVINNPNGLPRYGFSLSRVQQAAGRTHAHEMGHNFGNAHSRNQNSSAAGSDGGLFPYSTGWRWFGNNTTEYASVMTYREGAVAVNYFSNPNILYQGVPTGSYDGEYSPADNARSMNEVRHAIENYRTQSNDISVPTVSTAPASEISYSLATVGGTVSFDGGADVSQRGICWGSEENPALNGECQNIGSGVGSFEYKLTGLDQNSNYFVQAYATNTAGIGYGESKPFTTLELQKPQALFPASVNAVSFTARWSEVPAAERYFLDVSTDPDFNSFVNEYEDWNVGNGTKFLVDDLMPGNHYYYRVRSGAETTQSENSNVREITTTDISLSNSEVTLSRDRVLATGIQQSIVTVFVQDSNGDPVADADVKIEAEGGSSSISPSQTNTDASGMASFSITNNAEEVVEYSVSAEGLILNSEIEIEFLFSEGELTLGNNFPNPYNNQTQIPIVVPQQSRVRLDIFNSVGSLVQTIVDEEFTVGYYEIPFQAGGLSSGVYFYRMVTDQGMRVEKMLLAK
ncbi:MAG: M12 family metallo-peptidase [Balneolaceae bacterium]|nr:M12 family metallo-peptidase [Balneolaceae bacterium]